MDKRTFLKTLGALIGAAAATPAIGRLTPAQEAPVQTLGVDLAQGDSTWGITAVEIRGERPADTRMLVTGRTLKFSRPLETLAIVTAYFRAEQYYWLMEAMRDDTPIEFPIARHCGFGEYVQKATPTRWHVESLALRSAADELQYVDFTLRALP